MELAPVGATAASLAAAAAESEGPAGTASIVFPSPPLPPLERREYEFGELDHWLDLADQAIRRAQRVFEPNPAAPAVAPPHSARTRPLGKVVPASWVSIRLERRGLVW